MCGHEGNLLSVSLSLSPPPSQVSLSPGGVDMCVLQPYDAPLRRNYLPGVKVEYSVSPRQKFYRVKVNRIQVRRYDN